MNVLVYSEGWSGAPDPDALGVLSKAFSLGEPVTAVVCGGAAEEFMPVFASHGAGRVLAVQDRSFAEPVYTSRVDALEAICRRHDIDVLLFPTTALTVDVAASLAMRLEAGLCWGLVDVEIADGDLIGKRLAENDTVVAELKWTTRVKIGLFRPHVLEPMIVVGPAPEVEILLLDLPHRAAVPRLIEMKPREAGNDLALDRADIVVSGGRGLEKPENLGLVRELALALDGVIGVSLPLVEMGWAPRSMQVGQTGTTVRPRLYFACGISGQMQHRVGMENSGTIIAINRDGGAPIMSFCDLAVVAELESVVPRLIELLRQRRTARQARPI